MKKSIVIAGNGPSLRAIDYARLPKDFDVFRCNQFFFEDRYYLGKEITGFFISLDTVEESFTSSVVLGKRNEYFFQERYVSGLIFNASGFDWYHNIPSIVSATDILFRHPKIKKFVIDNYVAFNISPTTGTLMILTAIALGYQEIYVTGIDLYLQPELYAFQTNQAKTLATFVDTSLPAFTASLYHSLEYEYDLLKFTSTLEGIELYALSPNTLLAEYYPLAPVQNDTPYHPEEKEEDYLQDLVLSKRKQLEIERLELERLDLERVEYQNTHQGFVQKIKKIAIQKGLQQEWDFLREHWLIKLCYSIIKLPYICLKIIIKIFTN
ncbi:MAG: alpha-2,3-sialyltransferase [Brevinema sp.]